MENHICYLKYFVSFNNKRFLQHIVRQLSTSHSEYHNEIEHTNQNEMFYFSNNICNNSFLFIYNREWTKHHRAIKLVRGQEKEPRRDNFFNQGIRVTKLLSTHYKNIFSVKTVEEKYFVTDVDLTSSEGGEGKIIRLSVDVAAI